MISSPGCLCRTAGASGPSSTRFWITMRPGTVRSCSCRSVLLIPGACCTVVLMSKLLSRRFPFSLSQRSERGPQLLGEELRLLPGGEVAAPVDAVEVHEAWVGLLDPAARGPEDLAGKRGEADRDRNVWRRLAGRRRGLAVLPVHPRRGGAAAGQPVQRDVVEDVVSTEVARRLVVDDGACDLVVGVRVVVEHPGRERDW